MIVVFGSLNADMVFPVERLPRPGETVIGARHSLVPGGKGANQAVAAARDGAEVHMIGMVGRDGLADFLLGALRQAGVVTDGVGRSDMGSGCAAVCVDANGENQIAVAAGANLATTADQVGDGSLGPATTVLMQMEVPAAENWRLAARARVTGSRVLLTVAPSAPVPAAALADIDMLLVNENECLAVARDAGLPASDAVAAARRLAELHGRAVIVTLGGRGAVAFDNGFHRGHHWRVGALPVRAVDTTAAGDAFAGVLAAGLNGGIGLPSALHRASVAAGIACETAGAQTSLPDRATIDARLGELASAVASD